MADKTKRMLNKFKKEFEPKSPLADEMFLPNHSGVDRFFQDRIRAYGEIYAADVADEITITIAGKANKVKITSFAVNGVFNNCTPDQANNNITIIKQEFTKLTYLCT